MKGDGVADTTHPTTQRGSTSNHAFAPLQIASVEARLIRRLVLVGLFYWAMGVGLVLLLLPATPTHAGASGLPVIVLVSGIAMVVAVPTGVRTTRLEFRRATPFFLEQRAPVREERTALENLPAMCATIMLLCGTVVAGSVLVVCTFFYPWSLVLRAGSGVVVTVAGAWLLALLTAERTVGPLLGAIVDPSNVRHHLGLTGRLVAAWAMGGAVPLTALVIAPERIGLSAVQWTVLAMGLSLSLAAIWTTARSVAAPLRQLRAVVLRVERGDLNVVVHPSDGGELGQLQRAVAAMVSGLRERDRLQILFGRHVGTEVARRALAGDDTLGGELREVTALFVDVDDSTGLSQRLAPTDLVVLLNAFFAVVVEVVGAFGGFVNKFEGDAALAVFGAPGDDAAHAAHALAAAREIAERIKELHDVFPMLDAGIGVASGFVVAGNIGAADRYEYTAIGDPVNEASRLSNIAQGHPTRILTTARTVSEAGPEGGSWRHDGAVRLRGRADDTLVCCPGDVAAARGRRAGGRLTRTAVPTP